MKRSPERAAVNRRAEKTGVFHEFHATFADCDTSQPDYTFAMERWRFIFRGRVQGVGFRATTRHIALRHALTGWVRNEPDGSVAAEVQGAPDAIRDFLADLRAHFVRHIEGESRESLPAHADCSGFRIER